MLRITPVYGSRWSPEGQAEEPECTLVEFSGCRLLWNVGWWASPSSNNSSGAATPAQQPPQQSFPDLPDHDCLILTDSTLQAAGGLPLYYKAMQERHAGDFFMPPIYATYPTVKMGQMALYDQHAAISLDGGQPPYSLEDLDSAFGAIQSIKYSQSVIVHHPDTAAPSLAVTAHRAGHVVGGAFYTLERLQDETVVVLTSTYHVARELHLDSSTLPVHASTPDVLVTHPGGPSLRKAKALAHSPKKSNKSQRKRTPPALPPLLVTQAERNLTEAVLAVLRRDGNALLPADASGRVLELILLLQQQWEKQRLAGTYNLCWLGPMVPNTAEFARCQLEWMAVQLGQEFDSGLLKHPLRLQSVQQCTTLQELTDFMQDHPNPTVVVATGLSLEAGPARDVLLQWADNPDNAIIFTDSSQCYLRPSVVQQQQQQQPELGRQVSEAMSLQESTASAEVPPTTLDATTSTSSVAAAAASAAATTANPDNDDDDNEGEDRLIGSAMLASDVSKWTTAGQLLSAWVEAKAAGRQEMEDSVTIDVNIPHRAPLAGAELARFLEAEEATRLQKLKEQEKRAMLREVEIAKGQLRLGEGEDGGGGAGAGGSGVATTKATVAAPAASAAPTRPRKKSRFDSSLFLKFSKPLHLTFEVREEAVGIAQPDSTAKYGIGEMVGRSGEILEDDYGIAVLPELFTDIVSGVDPSKFAGGSGRIGDEVSRRGFGYSTSSAADGKKRGAPNMSGTTSSGRLGGARVSEDDDSGDEEMDERALEAIDLSEGTGIIRGRNGRPPTKVSTVPRKLEVLAEVSFVPLEGRVSAFQARQSVRALQPRQVVVLGGPAPKEGVPETMVDEVTILAEASSSFATGNQPVLVPSDGETTGDLHVGHSAYAVRLIDTPFQTAEEKEEGVEPPAPVETFETKLGACNVSLLDSIATGQKVALDGSIVLAPRPESSSSKEAAGPSVYLSNGELLLTDLRAELIAQGMKAEYSAQRGFSQLVVNGSILVRKEQDTGRVHVEGPLCEDFYTVRGIVCGQYVTL